MLSSKPYSTYEFIDSKSPDGDLQTKPAGIDAEICLEIRPTNRFCVSDIFAQPSFREKRLGVEFLIHNKDKLRGDLEVRCELKERGTEKLIGLDPVIHALNGEKSERATVYFDWKEPILWFPDDPRLLEMTLTFRHGGRILDRPFAVRFGFREVWAENSYLWMNGVRFWVRGISNGWAGHGEYVARDIEHFRERGINSGNGWFCSKPDGPQLQQALDTADELGFLSAFAIGGCSEKDPKKREAKFRKLFAKFRNHPCVYAYNIWSDSRKNHVGGYMNNPITIGRKLDESDFEAKYFIENRQQVAERKKIDPTRLFSFYERGVAGDYRSVMQYIGYGTPLQTREEYFSYWAENLPAPFVGTEMSMWLSMYAYCWQGPGYGGPNKEFESGTSPLVDEHAARYFGDAAYTKETKEWVERIQLHELRDKAYEPPKCPNFQRLTALVVKHCCRSWRTYGVSYQMLCVAYPAHLLPVKGDWWLGDVSLRENNREFLAYVGGASGDFVAKDHSFFSGEEIQKQIILINGFYHSKPAKIDCRVVECESGKMLASLEDTPEIGGGEIRKLPLSFNAPEVKVKTRCRIELKAALGGQEQADNFDFELFPSAPPPPAGNARYALLDKNGDGARLLAKVGIKYNALDVSAPIRPQLESIDVLLVGRNSLPGLEVQRKLLQAVEAGMNLICLEQTARHVFGLKNDDPNTRHAFISASHHPLLEGFSDEDFRNWRGASDILESYPDPRKGDVYGILDHKSAIGYFGENEFAHWSSKGTVAAFHLEKPQRGNFTALLSSGFDMLYTPLLEVQLGKGNLLACSLDVSNRYGKDPVATILVNRMLGHYSKKSTPNERRILLWGNRYWEGALEQLGRRPLPCPSLSDLQATDLLWLGLDEYAHRSKPLDKDKRALAEANSVKIKPQTLGADGDKNAEEEDFIIEELPDKEDKADKTTPAKIKKRLEDLRKNKDSISSFVSRGGIVILPFISDSAYLDWLPFSVKIVQRETCLGLPGGVAQLDGLGVADFFYREVLDLPAISAVPKGSKTEKNGFVSFVPHGKGMFVICQTYPDYFWQNWQKTKSMRIISTILRSCGAATEAMEKMTADIDRAAAAAGLPKQAEMKNAKPVEVQAPGVVADNYPQDIHALKARMHKPASGDALSPLYYCAPALDFNPDRHRSW